MNKSQLRRLIKTLIREAIEDFDTRQGMETMQSLQKRNLIHNMDDFTKGYVQSALFSSTDDRDESGGLPMDKNYEMEDIDEKTLQHMIEDCKKFQRENSQYFEKIDLDDSEAGAMFWYSRNGHGTGFWDVKDWKNEYAEAYGDHLHQAAKRYGEYNLYVGDGAYDGIIFGYPP